jgi:hypothetical protein
MPSPPRPPRSAGRGSGRTRRTIERILELGGLGLVVFLAGVVVGGLVVFLLHQQHWLPGGGTRQVEAFSDVGEPRAGELAERFRPWLAFDSRELWRPLNVDALLDEGTHRFCGLPEGASCTAIEDASAFDELTRKAGALGPATYLDLAGGRLRDYRGPDRCPPPQQDCGTGPGSAIYYHVTQSNDRFYVDYWWLLRFNHFPRSLPGFSCHSRVARENGVCDEHEGDWEGVTVVTPPDDDAHIDYVVYAAHKGTFRYTASLLRLHGGTRPVVYVAQGSHASYPAACAHAHDCSQPRGLAVDGLVDLPESRYDGGSAWERNGEQCTPNASGSCLISLTGQPWTSWPGQWGAGCGDACGNTTEVGSPRSPGLQGRFQTPWCSTQDGVISCDSRALRCSDWLGPLVVAVACDPLLLSKGLRATDTVEASEMALVLRGRRRSQATTPGVVQALGDPLRPGERLSVLADGSGTQVLVRAEQAGVVVEARFAGLASSAGQRVVITVAPGTDGPLVLADGQRPVERRVLESAS